jgi:hypothetical protein
VKYHHPKDTTLSFKMRMQPVYYKQDNVYKYCEYTDIDDVIEFLKRSKQEGFTEVQADTEGNIEVFKVKPEQEIIQEKLEYDERLKAWQAEYNEKMHLLEIAYHKKAELDAVLARL